MIAGKCGDSGGKGGVLPAPPPPLPLPLPAIAALHVRLAMAHSITPGSHVSSPICVGHEMCTLLTVTPSKAPQEHCGPQ